MSVKTYDPKEVVVLVGAVPISGFADGTFIKVSRANDTFSKVVGTDGQASRAKSNDKSGEIMITLAQTSASNDLLSGLAIADEDANSGVVPVTVKDNSGRTLLVSAFTWIKKQPDNEFAKEITNREWTFDSSSIRFLTGGNFETAAVNL